MPRPPPLVAVLNGPNLNMLGLGPGDRFGHETLDDVETVCVEAAEALGLAIDFRQSNHEGELVSWIQEFRGHAAGLVINPAGHAGSASVMDALTVTALPTIEVNIHNPQRPGAHRPRPLVARASTGLIYGLGIHGYALAITALAALLRDLDQLPTRTS